MRNSEVCKRLVASLIVFVIASFICVSSVKSTEHLGNSKISIIYSILVQEKVFTRAEKIACNLQIENKTDKLQFVSRPEVNDIYLNVKGLNRQQYSITFDKRGFAELAKIKIPLQPKCAIEIKLANILISKTKDGETKIPQGNYSITASWKKSGLPEIKPGSFFVVDENLPVLTNVPMTLDEYPLGILLEPYSKKYNLNEQGLFSIRLKNDGTLPIALLNYFENYIDSFKLEKKYAISNKKVEEDLKPGGLITPNAIEGWIKLLPEESLLVTIDASDAFKDPNAYKVTANYIKPILIYPKDGLLNDPHYPELLTFPPDGKPYYTKQHNWNSNEVKINIFPLP